MDAPRIAVFTGPRKVELQADPAPELVRGEALVRIRACALCTLEQRLWSGPEGEYPIAPGHETAGVVVAVHPEGGSGVEVGSRVAIAFLDRCLQCAACRRGESNLCTGKLLERAPGRLRRIGGLADYAAVPTWKLFPMPADLSFDELALCEPVACVVHSVSRAGLRFGDDVLVIGAGTMGFLHLALARLRGARVFVSDPDPEKRMLAEQHGAFASLAPDEAVAAVRAGTGGSGVDAVFVTFGRAETADQAQAAVRPGGRIVYYAGFPPGVASGVDLRRQHNEEVVLDGARGQTLEDWHQATRLVAGRLVDVRPLISGRFPLERLAEALERAADPSAYRIVVQP